jgi:hypothetical protein
MSISLRAGEGIGASGVYGIAAGEGLVHLDGGSLATGFFLLSKRRLAKQSNNNEEIIEGYLDFGRLMVVVFSDGISSSALC